MLDAIGELGGLLIVFFAIWLLSAIGERIRKYYYYQKMRKPNPMLHKYEAYRGGLGK